MINKETAIYPYWFSFHNKKWVLLWESSKGQDKFKTLSDGSLFISNSIEDTKKRLESKDISVCWSENSTMDFDLFWAELYNLQYDRPSGIKTCKILLEGWNFIEDLINTFNLIESKSELTSEKLNNVYDKLFFGNNLKSVTPKNKSYSPLWTKKEISCLLNSMEKVWYDLSRYTMNWGLSQPEFPLSRE